MKDIDRINDDGKRAIVSILNKGLAVEYTHILNYPRFIDQLININEVLDDDPCVVILKRLGEESVRHANIVMALISELGGKPQLVVEPAERMSDVFGMCHKQMEKEKENLALFQQARAVAETNQVKTLRGVLLDEDIDVKRILNTLKDKLGENIDTLRNRLADTVERSQVIQSLARLENDESRHMRLLDTVMLDITQHRNKSDD